MEYVKITINFTVHVDYITRNKKWGSPQQITTLQNSLDIVYFKTIVLTRHKLTLAIARKQKILHVKK
jgi:hypothetical protein